VGGKETLNFNKTMRKCGLILETGCANSQELNWMHTVSKTLCPKSQDVGSNPTTRKIVLLMKLTFSEYRVLKLFESKTNNYEIINWDLFTIGDFIVIPLGIYQLHKRKQRGKLK
jgi:hypothetical protein